MFVDTSVWSLFLRRDQPADVPQAVALRRALESGERIVTTGLVPAAVAAGFSGSKARDEIIDRFAAFPLLVPNREDHIEAAALRNECRRRGVQSGTIDALIAHLCMRHDLTLLTTDADFRHMAKHCALKVWDE